SRAHRSCPKSTGEPVHSADAAGGQRQRCCGVDVMNQLLAAEAVRLVGARPIAPTPTMLQPDPVRGRPLIPTLTVPASLPVLGSRRGSLFADRDEPNRRWYLPDFTLVEDVDPGFTFAASQSSQNDQGEWFNTARLTLRIRKLVPDDVLTFSQDN